MGFGEGNEDLLACSLLGDRSPLEWVREGNAGDDKRLLGDGELGDGEATRAGEAGLEEDTEAGDKNFAESVPVMLLLYMSLYDGFLRGNFGGRVGFGPLLEAWKALSLSFTDKGGPSSAASAAISVTRKVVRGQHMHFHFHLVIS